MALEYVSSVECQASAEVVCSMYVGSAQFLMSHGAGVWFDAKWNSNPGGVFPKYMIL